MGKGAFIGDGLDLYVTFTGTVAADQVTPVLTTMQACCHRFYEATDGRLHIKDVFWVDQNWGRNVSDVFFEEAPNQGILGQAQLDGLGVFGAKAQIFGFSSTPAAREQLAVAFVHELGHYLWGLGDEYGGLMLTGDLELGQQQQYDGQQAGANPAYRRVYLHPEFDLINPATQLPYDLTDCEVTLYFLQGNQYLTETQFAQEAVPTPDGGLELRINFGAGFTRPPSSAHQGRAHVRPFGSCGSQAAGFCLMAARGADTGRTELCTASNHDPALTTAQSAYANGASCWSSIAAVMAERYGLQIDPPPVGQPGTGQPAGAHEVGFSKLVKEFRVVLVFDRSGSMAQGNKMAGARAALDYWLTSLRAGQDLLGVIWYDHEIVISQELARVNQIPDLESVKDAVLSLEPRGATNIRGALDQAADLLIAENSASGRAVAQAVILMSDGVHNYPPPAEVALEVIPKFRQHGIQIFTLGLGTSETVAMAVLEGLAQQTAGKSFAAAIDVADADQEEVVRNALANLNFQFRGTLGADVDLEFAELPGSGPLPGRFRDWIAAGKRPKLEEILEAAGVASLAEVGAFDPAWFRVTSMHVEERAERAEFVLWYKEKHDLWLYLVDPDQQPVAPSDLHLLHGRAPFEGAVVAKPKRGRWTVVAVRVAPGPAFRARFSGGIDNRGLVVGGDSDRHVPLGAACRLWARAHWGDDLSGLDVHAKIRDPQGGSHTVLLRDGRPDEPFSGLYEGFFVPIMPGRHTGRIFVRNRGTALIANGLDRVAHSAFDAKEGFQQKLGAKVDRFGRIVDIYFDAGARPVPKDRDESLGLVGRYAPKVRFGKPLRRAATKA